MSYRARLPARRRRPLAGPGSVAGGTATLLKPAARIKSSFVGAGVGGVAAAAGKVAEVPFAAIHASSTLRSTRTVFPTFLLSTAPARQSSRYIRRARGWCPGCTSSRALRHSSRPPAPPRAAAPPRRRRRGRRARRAGWRGRWQERSSPLLHLGTKIQRRPMTPRIVRVTWGPLGAHGTGLSPPPPTRERCAHFCHTAVTVAGRRVRVALGDGVERLREADDAHQLVPRADGGGGAAAASEVDGGLFAGDPVVEHLALHKVREALALDDARATRRQVGPPQHEGARLRRGPGRAHLGADTVRAGDERTRATTAAATMATTVPSRVAGAVIASALHRGPQSCRRKALETCPKPRPRPRATQSPAPQARLRRRCLTCSTRLCLPESRCLRRRTRSRTMASHKKEDAERHARAEGDLVQASTSHPCPSRRARPGSSSHRR